MEEAAEIPAAHGRAIDSVPVSLVLDGIVLLLLLAASLFLFEFLLRLLTRGGAHRSWARTSFLVLLTGLLCFALNPTRSLYDGVKAILVATLAGGLLAKRLFWIDLDKALLSVFLHAVAISALDFGVGFGLDHLLSDRKTIGRTLTRIVDDRTRRAMGDETLEPSRGLASALQRYSACDPDQEGTIIDGLLAPVRAGAKAQQKIREINAIATEQAKLVNMLSGAGTNLTSRADELKALQAAVEKNPEGAMRADARGLPAPDDASLLAAATGPNQAAAGATDWNFESKTDAPPSNATPHKPAARVPSAAAPPAPPRAGPGKAPAAPAAGVEAAPGQDPWALARQSIKVTGVGHSTGSSSYVLIGTELVKIGGTYTVNFGGREYTFRLADIDWRDRCDWTPVTNAVTTNAGARVSL